MGKKVIWREGMALSPHHFQQSQRLSDEETAFRWKLYTPFSFGFQKISIDDSSLGTGIFSIKEVAGVFPDGTAFNFPHSDPQMSSRSFDSLFSANMDKLDVYLATAELEPRGVNLQDFAREGDVPRFVSKPEESFDLNNGQNPRPVEIGIMQLKVFFEGENTDGHQVLKIAELIRDSAGKIELNSLFIPPLLQIGASHALMTQLKRLIDTVTTKGKFLMSQRTHKATGVAQFTSESLHSYLMLSSLNQFLPYLKHLYMHGHCHPEELYLKLAEFYGSLLAFGELNNQIELTAYSHNEPGNGFVSLFQMLLKILDVSVQSHFQIIPLTKTSPVQSLANLKEISDFAGQQLYLGVSAQASEVEIINHMQRNAKLGPPGKIDQLVRAATGGIGLIPESQPPASMPTKAGYKYFKLLQEGDMWQGVMQSKALALNLPTSLPGQRMELISL